MKIKFTEKELVQLGWDDPSCLAAIAEEDPFLRASIRKVNRREDLSPEEVTAIAEAVNLLCAGECDGAATARRIMRKVEKAMSK